MAEPINSSDLVVSSNYDDHLREFEIALMWFLEQHHLPTESILVPVDDRAVVLRNIVNVMTRISDDKKSQSTYISKFVAAVASGLFDAALNYLWDETILQLRTRVANYDLKYFVDNAISNPEKRKDLSSVNDLTKIDDGELIYGAREIELISDVGFRHLDYIRNMRNWASAAHPNQTVITGLQLISWLETCIIEVISPRLSGVVVQIKKLLANIKTNIIDDMEAKEIATFFLNLTQDQVNNLASGFFGLYTRPDTTKQTRGNIRRLLPYLWERVDEPTRQQFGIKHSKFAANNDQQEKKLARRFLELVSAASYISDDIRALEIQAAIENLLNAHREYNNFYNEPPFASELRRLVGKEGNIPRQVLKSYVLAIVEVFLTNGYGVVRMAEPIYIELLHLFNSTEVINAILSINNMSISDMLYNKLCDEKYREMLEIIKIKVSMPAVKELINFIEQYNGPLYLLKDEVHFKQKVAFLEKIIMQSKDNI